MDMDVAGKDLGKLGLVAAGDEIAFRQADDLYFAVGFRDEGRLGIPIVPLGTRLLFRSGVDGGSVPYEIPAVLIDNPEREINDLFYTGCLHSAHTGVTSLFTLFAYLECETMIAKVVHVPCTAMHRPWLRRSRARRSAIPA